jgi:hypothetical protein
MANDAIAFLGNNHVNKPDPVDIEAGKGFLNAPAVVRLAR